MPPPGGAHEPAVPDHCSAKARCWRLPRDSWHEVSELPRPAILRPKMTRMSLPAAEDYGSEARMTVVSYQQFVASYDGREILAQITCFCILTYCIMPTNYILSS